jgi:hypothetical protein
MGAPTPGAAVRRENPYGPPGHAPADGRSGTSPGLPPVAHRPPGPDGGWTGNGRFLTPEQSWIAGEALSWCRRAEGRNASGTYGHSGLTAAMRRIEAVLQHGQLLPDTEAHALKPPERFRERFADLIARHPDKPANELAREVHDGVRYTFIFDLEQYADGVLHVHSRLKGQGFDLEIRRNGWNSRQYYKGIITRWRDPAHGLPFEVQFHTPASWDIRERAIGMHRMLTDPAMPPPDRARLREMRADLMELVPTPPSCAAIPDFRKPFPAAREEGHDGHGR